MIHLKVYLRPIWVLFRMLQQLKINSKMKKLFFSITFILFVVFGASATANLTAYLTYATFNAPVKGPYVETYLSVIGNSVKFVKNGNGKYHGAIDIAVNFVQNGEIKNAQKYTLNSPETDDTTKNHPNFIDQQRYSLPKGAYSMEISIADKYQPTEKPFVTKMDISIDFPNDKVAISDIQLLESFVKSTSPGILTKSGYDLLPYVSTFYPENINKIKFYAEIYNSKKINGDDQKLVFSYFLESNENKIKLTDYSAFSKQTSNDVNVLLSELSIEKLPSGNYNLVIEARDKENKLLAEKKCFIQRKNTQGKLSQEDLKSVDVNNTFVSYYKNLDTLTEYIRCLRPISSASEIQYAENQVKEKKLEQMQQLFYNFWKSRDEKNPQLMWLNYYTEVMKVNNEFGTYGLKGYDTDRGRVYLQYGPPDQRTRSENEPSAFPYEIWEYYTLYNKALSLTYPDNRQSNRKFVFYDSDLVSNKYRLLHSTAKGEIYNSRWELDIHKRDTQSNNLDNEKSPDHFGSHVDDNFNSPR